MTKNNNSKLLFIDPYFSQFKYNTAGIAYLRGYLSSKNIASATINFNKYIDKEIEQTYKNSLIKILKNTQLPPYYQNLIAAGSIDVLILQNAIFSIMREARNLYDTIRAIDVFDSIFEDIIRSRDNTEHIAISISFPAQIIFSFILVSFIKTNYARIKLTLGGRMVTQSYSDVMVFLNHYPIVDYVIVGEGETPFYKLIIGSKLDEVPNLTYKKADTYYQSKNQLHYEDLTKLPGPTYEPKDEVYLEASRKCCWDKCIYCQHNSYPHTRNMQVRSAEQVAEDLCTIQSKKSYYQSRYYFIDSCLPTSFMKKFSDIMIERNIPAFKFAALIRCDKANNFEILQRAKVAGFNKFLVGPETLVPRLLKIINKGHTRENTLCLIENCYKLNIKLMVHFVVHLPTQTREELLADLGYIKRLMEQYPNIVDLAIHKLAVGQKSLIYSNPEKYSTKILDHNNFFNFGIPYEYSGAETLSHRQTIRIVRSYYVNQLQKNKKITLDI